jgi:hypothetical protein
MPFSDAQTKLLAGKLSEKAVKTRKQDGRLLSYIEGWYAIAEANRIFGFDGWDRETLETQCIWQDAKREAKSCAYVARVRIRVRAGDWVISRDGSGTGHGSAPSLGEAHESALKEAETDATKRALATFGNLFGLALYDRAQNGVRRRNGNGNGIAAGVSWALLSATGGVLSRHGVPEEFCGALRELMERTPALDRLKSIWARNAGTVTHLRRAWPDLKTVNGTHYGDVLEKLFEQQIERLAQGGDQEVMQNTVIDKAELALALPRRLRDVAHREFVASLPCLVCGRSPSHAHHLRFAQPRSLGSKVSDEWTVPLCIIHHRALHDFGAEEKWWEQIGIDALSEAEKLWRQSHHEPPHDADASPAAEIAEQEPAA